MPWAKYGTITVPFTIVRKMATVKRFYRRTNILCNGDKYEITLDQRKLKTPEGRIFEVENKALALAVAAEWDSQRTIIDRSTMHLTALCNSALDNPHKYTKLDIAMYIINYLETDTVLFQSSDTDELYKLQVKRWDPLIQWFCDHYQVDIVKTQSIEAPLVPEETKRMLLKHLLSYDYKPIYGIMYGVDILKSVILTLAMAKRKISVEEAVNLTQLEQEYQTSHWGSVEWYHELSKQDLRARTAAAMLFFHLNCFSATSRSKKVNANN